VTTRLQVKSLLKSAPGRDLSTEPKTELHESCPEPATFRTIGSAHRLALALLVEQFDERVFIPVLELVRFEVGGLGLDDMPAKIEHLLGDLNVLDVVEIFVLVAVS
jgi:hypothetical protein